MSVYNLSTQSLTEGEISLFALGPKFVPVTEVDPLDTKVDILRFSRKLLLKAHFHGSEFTDDSLIRPNSILIPKKVKSEVLKNVIEDLEMFSNDFQEQVPKIHVDDNLTPEQRQAIEIFKKREALVYFKADKGSAVVILDEDFYRNKVLELLSDTTKYMEVPNSADLIVMTKLNTFIQVHSDAFTPTEKKAITDLDYKSTNIYGVPKIHKSKIIKEALGHVNGTYMHVPNPADLELRLIFGGPVSPASGLAEWVDIILKRFLCKVKSRVKDVFEFIRRNPVFSPETLEFVELISLDVKSMYPNLEQNLGLPALRYFLTRYKSLLPQRSGSPISVDVVINAMKFVLDSSTGYFNGGYYNQKMGTATGIMPAPSYADLAMGYFELLLIEKIALKLGKEVAAYFWQHYRRFLDDGFIFWDKRLGDFVEVFKLMNSIYPTIEFTMERSDTSLKYLDIVVYKSPTGIKTVVYNKETDSGTYLPWDSSHPHHCKKNIPFGLTRRIKTLTDDPELAWDRMLDLAVKLKGMRYPEGLVNTAMQDAMQLSTPELRNYKPEKQGEDNSIAFVHTYDPTRPELLQRLKKATAGLSTSSQTRHIFGGMRIIDSRREPFSLKRLFQKSRYNGSGRLAIDRGVSKCGQLRCCLCQDILEGDSVSFDSSGIKLIITHPMDCRVRNVIYAIWCKGCNKSYVGETVCLRERMNTHRSNSNHEDRASMEVSRHLLRCDAGFWVCPLMKVREDDKILRLVNEDELVKLVKPDLNADRRNLLHLHLSEG